MKLLGIVLLSIASIAVLVGMVLPVAALILGLGIDIPNFWARSAESLSYPFVSLGFPSSWPAISRCFWLGHMEAYSLNSTFPISASVYRR